MKTFELIQRLALFPPTTEVKIGHDWSDPWLDDSYLQVEGNPTVAIKPTGWAAEQATSDGGEKTDGAESPSLSHGEVVATALVKLNDAIIDGDFSGAEMLARVYGQLTA